jgi:nucleotide-binding universal stress UspA family protein
MLGESRDRGQGLNGTIVCGVKEARAGRAAAQLAAALAARLDLRLVLVHVVTDARDGTHAHAGGDGRDAAEPALAAIARELDHPAEIRVVVGNRVDGLAQVAADEGADVIVLGSRSGGARGRRLRCTLARELEVATVVPVLVAPPATHDRSGRRLTLAQAVAGR